PPRPHRRPSGTVADRSAVPPSGALSAGRRRPASRRRRRATAQLRVATTGALRFRDALLSAEVVEPGAERGERSLTPCRRAAHRAELGEKPVDHAERVVDVGEPEEEIVLERRARIARGRRVALAENRTADALVGEHPAVEDELPAP